MTQKGGVLDQFSHSLSSYYYNFFEKKKKKKEVFSHRLLEYER